MAHNDHLLESLCRDSETLSHARSILRTAQKKTGPGSGHELGAHTTGLPAICAHIASQRLNNNDVTRKNAQAASCLKASDFEKAFHIVEAAIGGSRTKPAARGGYDTLLRTHKPSIDHERLLDWTRAVERTLLQANTRFTPEDAGVRSAIFFWVCQAATGKVIQAPQPFAEDNDIPFKNFKKLLDTITKNSTSLATRIQSEMKAKRASPIKTGTTPRRSPTKPTLRTLPSKDFPQKRKAEIPQQAHDELTSDVDLLDTLMEPETPIKKRKLDSPSKSIQRISPQKSTFAPVASSSRVRLDVEVDHGRSAEAESTTHAISMNPSTPKRPRPTPTQHDDSAMNVDPAVDSPSSSDEDDEEIPLPRRFRPVYVDHKQWFSRDPRLNRIWKQAEKRKRDLVQLRGHPFEKYRPQSTSLGLEQLTVK